MNKMKKLTLAFLLAGFTTFSLHAQSSQKAFFGLGAGLDYGGLGIRGELQPQQNIGIFVGAGYNFADPAYNVGASFKLPTRGSVQPVLTAMYGYNAVLKIKYGSSVADAKTYYGPSVGAGVEIFDHHKKNKWLLEILAPFRSRAFHNHYQALKDAGFTFSPDILPVTFTVGYNFSVTAKPRKPANP